MLSPVRGSNETSSKFDERWLPPSSGSCSGDSSDTASHFLAAVTAPLTGHVRRGLTDNSSFCFSSALLVMVVMSSRSSGSQAGADELVGQARQAQQIRQPIPPTFASGTPTTAVVDDALTRKEARNLLVMTHKLKTRQGSGNAFQQYAEPVAHDAEQHRFYTVRPAWVIQPVVPAIVVRRQQPEGGKEEEEKAPKKGARAPPPPPPKRPDYDIHHATASVEIAKVAACMGASFSPAAQALRGNASIDCGSVEPPPPPPPGKEDTGVEEEEEGEDKDKDGGGGEDEEEQENEPEKDKDEGGGEDSGKEDTEKEQDEGGGDDNDKRVTCNDKKTARAAEPMSSDCAAELSNAKQNKKLDDLYARCRTALDFRKRCPQICW